MGLTWLFQMNKIESANYGIRLGVLKDSLMHAKIIGMVLEGY